MLNLLTKFLVSRAGSIATPIIATAVAAAVARVAAYDPALAGQMDERAIVGFIVAVLVSAVNYFTNARQSAGVKQIQALVNAPKDGFAGPLTYTEVRRAIPTVR